MNICSLYKNLSIYRFNIAYIPYVQCCLVNVPMEIAWKGHSGYWLKLTCLGLRFIVSYLLFTKMTAIKKQLHESLLHIPHSFNSQTRVSPTCMAFWLILIKRN